MNARIRSISFGLVDVVGAACALGVAVLVWLLLIRGPVRQGAGLESALARSRRLGQSLAAAQTERQRLAAELEQSRRRLTEVGGGLPRARQVDQYLGKVTAIAAASGVIVDSLVPLPPAEFPDHTETYVHFAGRGSFVGLHQMLRAIEQELDYADVTHFAITSGDRDTGGDVCQIGWSLRIHSTRTTPLDQGVAHAGTP